MMTMAKLITDWLPVRSRKPVYHLYFMKNCYSTKGPFFFD